MPPNKDLPSNIKRLYKTAQLRLNDSPADSAQYLRLAFQALMQEVGISDNPEQAPNFNQNESIDMPLSMFRVLNFAAEELITKQRLNAQTSKPDTFDFEYTYQKLISKVKSGELKPAIRPVQDFLKSNYKISKRHDVARRYFDQMLLDEIIERLPNGRYQPKEQ